MSNSSYLPTQPTSTVLVSANQTVLTASNSITLAAAGSWSDVTDGSNNLQVTFTPSASGNRIFIFLQVSLGGASSVNYHLRLLQDGSPILVGGTASNRMLSTLGLSGFNNASLRTVTFYGAITAGTTSSTTIKLQAARSSNATLNLNKSITDTNTAAFVRGVSSLALFEFSA